MSVVVAVVKNLTMVRLNKTCSLQYTDANTLQCNAHSAMFCDLIKYEITDLFLHHA